MNYLLKKHVRLSTLTSLRSSASTSLTGFNRKWIISSGSFSTSPLSSEESFPPSAATEEQTPTKKKTTRRESTLSKKRKAKTTSKVASPISSTSTQNVSANLLNQSLRQARRRPQKPIVEENHDHVKDINPAAKAQLQVRGRPLITVMGVGGAGGNAVNNMIASQLQGVEFVIANTDSQALVRSLASHKITLGKTITRGLGAGSKPELGRTSAEQQYQEIYNAIVGSNMLFITGGMGGGTCTGAAPVIAKIARELGILTVAVVSTPFRSEGPNRTRIAHAGVKELASAVDTLIIVPNQNLLSLSTKETTMLDAFRHADAVLMDGVKGMTDLIVKPGLINLDFADISTTLSGAGRAMMGSGTASGKGRAALAAKRAFTNPLLGDLPTESANGLLVTITGGKDLTLFEVDEIMNTIRELVAEDAKIIIGTCYDESVAGEISVSVIVAGIKTDHIAPPTSSKTATPLSAKSEGTATEKKSHPEPSTGFFSRFFTL